ncbi:Outer membrane translocase receptor tom70 [Ceratobasidium theobromae]|uniref:Outer membrane translocase receptor tom70 n=1 Tax=Ceratobasidium theobromae TaxID=1582974 RepID=A0A5N5QKU5_9AGAM|nr:Outer membrane translocase receptor tom70 [Ceratobasidium theobromae]
MTPCGYYPDRCVLTLESEPIEFCQIFRLNDLNNVKQLEHAWGMKHNNLNLDDIHNKIPLKVDLHRTFESDNWALVPSLDCLKEIAAKAILLAHPSKVWPVYLEWFPNKEYVYSICHFKGAPTAFLRHTNEDSGNILVYKSPFSTVPGIEAPLHPYFAISHVAQKAIYFHEKQVQLNKLPDMIQDCVDLCVAIYSQWLGVGTRISETSIERGVHSFVERNVDTGHAGAANDGNNAHRSPKTDNGGIDEELLEEKEAPERNNSIRHLNQPDAPREKQRSDLDPGPNSIRIQGLSIENLERIEQATELKERGNTAYKQQKFEEAIRFYTQAIDMSPTPQAVYYSNRAACYAYITPPNHDRAIEDCTMALNLDPKYAKALNRRACTLEATERLEEALRDFTALAIIETSKGGAAEVAGERVLSKLSAKQAQEIMRNRQPRLPSVTFIRAYFAAFRNRPHVMLPENPSTGDQKLFAAQVALSESQYARAYQLVGEAFEDDLSESWREGYAEALNLRGTFKFLMDDPVGAKADFMDSIQAWPNLIQSWVKIASAYLELNEAEEAFAAFEKAIELDAECADIYYHRGQDDQVFFILSDFEKAAENYIRSSELDPSFLLSHIQLAVAQYKMMNIDESIASFKKTLLSFPGRGEPYNYFGEVLLDQQRFQEAIEQCDKAIEIEKQRPTPNPLPLVNKALVLYQWRNDLPGASALCREALSYDEECDAAVDTLAQLTVQQGHIEEAIEMFEKQAAIARTKTELVRALNYVNASKAQLEFQKNYPDMVGQLQQRLAGV